MLLNTILDAIYMLPETSKELLMQHVRETSFAKGTLYYGNIK
ncbi:MAG TPA: hypothetical protein VLY87_03450 [Flavobacterium sp.]|nr:hypothetical protein [Flavobacterium sp.]